MYGVDQPHAQLPQYVFKADFCPNTNDSSQWKDASDRLHCLHDLDSTDARNVYHCLPTSFLNETVEFCGKAITVPPGYLFLSFLYLSLSLVEYTLHFYIHFALMNSVNLSYLTVYRILPYLQLHRKIRRCTWSLQL